MIPMRTRPFRDSFCDAFSGLWYCISSQRNMKVHLATAVFTVIICWLLGLNRLEVALIIFAISLVLVTEMVNTAVERAVDLFVNSTYHPLARLSKHIAAGAVLLAALNAVVIGLLVFIPHLHILR